MGFYQEIESRVPNRSVFNLSHRNVTSFQFNKLYPTLCEETLPDDTFRMSSKMIARFAPMLTPAFGSLKAYHHFFYIPRRIIDPSWKNFWTERTEESINKWSWKTTYANANLLCKTVFQNPTIAKYEDINTYTNIPNCQVFSKDSSILGQNSLCDYLGITPLDFGEFTNEDFDITPLIAYQYVYNEYYRDTDIEDDLFGVPYRHLWWLTSEGWRDLLLEITSPNGRFFGLSALFQNDNSIVGSLNLSNIINRSNFDGWLPFTTYNRAISLLINPNFDYLAFEEIIHDLFHMRTRAWYKDRFTSARTNIVNDEIPIVPVKFNEILEPQNANNAEFRDLKPGEPFVASNSTPTANITSPTSTGVTRNNQSQYLLTKLGFTISALRLANAIQKHEEKIVMFGKRYIEQLASRFGVISSDASLQRPQYFGGSQQDIYMNEISQTSQSNYNSAQGNYAGQAITDGKSKDFDFYCEEHGWILCITSFMAETAYSQGLDLKFTRNNNALNFYDPNYACLTDSEVKNKEVFVRSINLQRYYDEMLAQNYMQYPIGKNDDTFGYQGRWDEYRVHQNRYCGQMRDELREWHFGRKFGSIRDYVRMANTPTTSTSWQISATSATLVFWVANNSNKVGDSNIYVPLSWFNPSILQNLSSADYSALLSGTKGLALTINFNNIDNYSVLPLQEFFEDVLTNLPKLLPSFIHSNVPTVPFAETTEFDNIKPILANNYECGDDYIFADMFFNITAVRPMPEQSVQKL